MTTPNTPYHDPKREISGLTAAVEKRALVWLAARLPAWVMPDHLTALGLLALLVGGLAYVWSASHPWLLFAVNLALVVNWFGDSLDGTLARYRQKQRPRFGYYVDHVVDAFGALFLLGGLILSGLVTPGVATTLLVVYYLFGINTYLATHVLGRFKISFGPVGGTELRLLLAALNTVVFFLPRFSVQGTEGLVFDVAVIVAIVALSITLVRSVVQVTHTLFVEERV
jgi:archaetidylinositol phosphate synthase